MRRSRRREESVKEIESTRLEDLRDGEQLCCFQENGYSLVLVLKDLGPKRELRREGNNRGSRLQATLAVIRKESAIGLNPE